MGNLQENANPSLEKFKSSVDEILSRMGTQKSLLDDGVQHTLSKMRASDFDRLRPPPLSEYKFWTDDVQFCKRLACYVFGVSSETLEELPVNYYPLVLSIISQNFVNFMAGAIPG